MKQINVPKYTSFCPMIYVMKPIDKNAFITLFISIMMGKTTLITQRILFEQKKYFMCKIISERIVRKSYFIGIQGFKFYTMLFRPVLIDLGVWYFDTMCATVYCFVHYQSHFGQLLELTGFYSTVTIYR